MNSIIPTKTGAASAVGKVLPSLNGKLDGIALRVPVACGSITDFVCVTEKETNVDEVNNLLQAAANTTMNGILAVSSDPLVSIDIVGRKESSIIDAELTKVDGNLIKLVSWYDNESGYSARLIDLCSIVTEQALTKI
jgi:glyceraldehyde 3-phosphate dehydrogenase